MRPGPGTGGDELTAAGRMRTGASQSVDGTTRGSGQIGVFLLDDHEIVRTGVRDVLEAEPDITVVGEAGTAGSALARIPALRPDVAVLDVRLPDGDGGKTYSQLATASLAQPENTALAGQVQTIFRGRRCA